MKYGPRNISEGFDGIPNHLQTAFVWSGNGKTYFVKGDLACSITKTQSSQSLFIFFQLRFNEIG